MASCTKDREYFTFEEIQHNKKWLKLATASKQKRSMHGNGFQSESFTLQFICTYTALSENNAVVSREVNSEVAALVRCVLSKAVRTWCLVPGKPGAAGMRCAADCTM